MKTPLPLSRPALWLAFLLTFFTAKASAQIIVDCSCLATQAVLRVNGCQGTVPDMCLFPVCIRSSVVPPPAYMCSQTPVAGTIVGPGTTAITVTISIPGQAPILCPLNFVVTPPAPGAFSLTCAGNKSVQCGLPWSFDPPASTNACCNAAGTPGNVAVSVISTVTNGVCPQVITRTWQAVDDCGQAATCSQTVTVVDTTPPTINCGPSQIVNCGQAWNFSTPTYSDNCTPAAALVLSVVSTISSGTCPGVITRTWLVTDLCGNKTVCTETVTIQDLIPPTITCAPNKTVPCGTQWNFNPPSATDNCASAAGPGVTIAVVSTVTNSLCPLSVTRTWSATDACGNISQCSQTVTVAGGLNSLTLNCAALAALPELQTNACLGDVPALCAQAIALAQQNCPCPVICTQTPTPGTQYGPGTYPITVTLSDGNGGTATCTVNFVITAPPGGCITNPCPPTLTGVLNTGTTNGNGGLLPTGAQEQVWVNIDSPSGPIPMVVGDTNQFPIFFGPWVQPTATSTWVSPSIFNQGPAGWYTNRVTFDASCTNVCLKGRVASDDDGYLFVNGVLVTGSGFTVWSNVNHCADFVKGPNVIEFVVHNAGGPTGFRTELEFWEECCCIPLTNVWNSGFATNGTAVVAQGNPDPYWTLVSFPTGGCNGPAQVLANTGIPGAWMPNGPDSLWVGPSLFTANCAPGVYHYQHRLVIPCTNTASIIGQFVADDVASLELNGVQQASTVAGNYVTWSPVNITSGFVAAPSVNVLDLYVTNAIIYTGFRAELTNNFDDCCKNTNCIVTIQCPPKQSITHCLLADGVYPVIYPAPVAQSVCSTITSVVCTPPSGAPFPPGTTPVTCTATDALGNSTSCSFTVTVAVVPLPTITCPANSTVNSACGQACAVVNYPAPVVLNGTLVRCSPPSGTCFPIGTTTVICRATNICNNRAFCTFSVTVLPYVLPCAPPPPNMALWLPFDEATGLTAGNLAGGNIGTLINGPAHQLGSYVNNSLCFDGVNDYVQVVSHPAIQFGTGDFTVDAWVKPASLNSNIRIIAEHRAEIGASAIGWSLFLGGNNGLAFQIGDGAYINYPSTLTVPADGRWHLVAVTVNRSNPNGLRFYVDGVIDSVPRDPTPYSGNLTPPANYPFRVSSRSSSLSGFFPGCIDEVELFRRALTSSEISAIYNAGPYGKCRPGSNGVVPPLTIKCPPDQTILTCSNSAKAFYKASATGNLGPILCVPPSGSTFPIGTNTVTCTVTNICGATAWCSFKVIVKSYGPLSPFPSATYWAGVPDNYLGTTEPANVSACLNTAFSPVPFRSFDQTGDDRVLAHRFTGLPNNIVQAILVVRMKPSLTDPNSNNDGLFLGFGPVCTSSTFVYGNAIRLLPGAVPATGGTWVAGNNGSTTFTLNLGTLNPALLTKMNSEGFLDVAIHDDTIVDYMQLRIWRCPPPTIGIGVPHNTGSDTVAASILSAMPAKVLPGFGPIGVGPSVCVLPPAGSAIKVSEVEMDMGGGHSFSFTTVLDMDAPDGAMMEIVDPLDPMGVPLLTLSKECCGGGWDLKKCKGGISDRVGFNSTAVNDNGDLLGSFFQTLNEGNTNAALVLQPEDENIRQFPVTLTFNRGDGTITVIFPGSARAGGPRRKGWDGTIKRYTGEDALRKGWDGTIKGRPPGASIVTFTPNMPHPIIAPVLNVIGTDLDEWLLTSETVTTMAGLINARNAANFNPELFDESGFTAAWFQSTAASDGVSVVSLADGAGVSLDLGHSESFRAGLHHFENGDIPTQGEFGNLIDSTLRVIGGPWILTNRPPPPVLDLRFVGKSNEVALAVDFSPLQATSIRVELWSNGTMMASGANPGPVITPDDEFFIGRIPERFEVLGVLGGVRVLNSEMFSVQGQDNGQLVTVYGDEIRLIPEVPASTELPLYLTALECLGNEGLETLIYDLQRAPACTPTELRMRQRPDMLTAEWDSLIDESFTRLQGSENLNGPWFELGGKSPYPVSTNTPAKFFRLICE